MNTHKYELIQELNSLLIRAHEIEMELRTYFNSYAIANSEFKANEIVKVFEDGKHVGNGIVNRRFHGLNYSWDAYEIKKYCENPKEFEKELKNIRYNIKAIKKDGTMSERNFKSRSSYGIKTSEHDDHYITKL